MEIYNLYEILEYNNNNNIHIYIKYDILKEK